MSERQSVVSNAHRLLRRSNDADETVVFASQRLCQMLKTFDMHWSKQTSIPTILLHGIEHFTPLVDYACRQSGYHCHTVIIERQLVELGWASCVG